MVSLLKYILLCKGVSQGYNGERQRESREGP